MKLRTLSDIPENCKKKGTITKDSCKVVCSDCNYIINHDCMSSEGCDAVAINTVKKRACIIECKGRLSEQNTKKAVKQLNTCREYYKECLKDFDKIYLILRRGRVEAPARAYVKEVKKNRGGLKGLQMYRCGADISKVL